MSRLRHLSEYSPYEQKGRQRRTVNPHATFHRPPITEEHDESKSPAPPIVNWKCTPLKPQRPRPPHEWSVLPKFRLGPDHGYCDDEVDEYQGWQLQEHREASEEPFVHDKLLHTNQLTAHDLRPIYLRAIPDLKAHVYGDGYYLPVSELDTDAFRPWSVFVDADVANGTDFSQLALRCIGPLTSWLAEARQSLKHKMLNGFVHNDPDNNSFMIGAGLRGPSKRTADIARHSLCRRSVHLNEYSRVKMSSIDREDCRVDMDRFMEQCAVHFKSEGKRRARLFLVQEVIWAKEVRLQAECVTNKAHHTYTNAVLAYQLTEYMVSTSNGGQMMAVGRLHPGNVLPERILHMKKNPTRSLESRLWQSIVNNKYQIAKTKNDHN